MPKWVSLKDLMENPSKYGVKDPRLLEIAYIPDKQIITLTPDMTGYCTEQTLETETKKHKYYPLMHKGKLYLVSNKVTKIEVFLKGKTGYDNGPKVLKEQAKLWSNEELGVRGETWNEERIGILDILPEFLRKIKGTYWIAIQWNSACYFGLQRVTSSGVYGNILYYYRSGSMYSTTLSYAVRPLVSLPSNIQVNIESIDCRPLELRLPKEK